jgi:hypothetical protein
LVRSDVGVVEESETEPSLKVLLKEGLERAEAQCVFEGFPESLDEGDGADLADGTEAMPHVKSGQEARHAGVGELRTVVGNEMTRRAEPTRGGSKELLDLSGRRFCGKDASGDWHAREGVENDSDLRMKESEQTRDVGQVGQHTWLG